jgi:hypothetical protein
MTAICGFSVMILNELIGYEGSELFGLSMEIGALLGFVNGGARRL